MRIIVNKTDQSKEEDKKNEEIERSGSINSTNINSRNITPHDPPISEGKEEVLEGNDAASLERIKKKKRTKKLKGMGDGYNSSDEYGAPLEIADKQNLLDHIRNSRNEFERFEAELKRKKGYIIKKMEEDGNCLFRSVADQVFGFPEMHDQVRSACINYMRAERDHYSQFVTEDFDDYLRRKSQDKSFGNNLEIQALGELYSRPIEIYMYNHNGLVVEPINIFHGQYQTDNAPIRLSYHNRNHYNSVIDPNNPSIGVGLGLPGYEPGVADRNLMKDALERSEQSEIEEMLLGESRKESEWELTEKEIEEAIIAQSQRELEEKILEESRKSYYESLKKE